MTTKKTPTKQSKKDAKAAEKAKNKKQVKEKSASKCKCFISAIGLSSRRVFHHSVQNHYNGRPAHHLSHLTGYLPFFICIAKSAKPKDTGKPEKKTRKKKDADAPKKPMSAFFWY